MPVYCSTRFARQVVPPEQHGDEAWFITNVANTFLEFVTNSLSTPRLVIWGNTFRSSVALLVSQPLPPRAPAEVIYSTPRPTSPAPQRPQAQASTAAHAIEEQQTYGAQYLNGIVPPPSLPPTGNPVNPDAIYESSSSSSSLGFGMMTSSLSGGSSRQDSSLASLGSCFSLGHDVPLGNSAAISAPESGLTEAARTPPRSSKLRAEAPIFVPGTGLVLAD